jgi:hypothetical protein
MAKKVCTKKEKNKKETDNKKFVCKKCGLRANKEHKLCKPRQNSL